MKWIEDIWYKKKFGALFVLLPVSMLFILTSYVRTMAFEFGFRKKTRLSKPVIVVGNITVGGSGKTPIVIHICQILQQKGVKVGVLSRGYKGKCQYFPYAVQEHDTAEWVGDEPLLIKKKLNIPVVIDPKRVRGGQWLLEHNDVDCIITDDGLQHYALERDYEIVVVDSLRKWGNGYRLPAGPLREPVTRLKTVNAIIFNGLTAEASCRIENELSHKITKFFGGMHLKAVALQNVVTGERQSVSSFHGKSCHAYAGIGNPERFFESLLALDFHIEKKFPMEDHHQYNHKDFDDDAAFILMTAKDAIKCHQFPLKNAWFVDVNVQFAPSGFECELFDELCKVISSTEKMRFETEKLRFRL